MMRHPVLLALLLGAAAGTAEAAIRRDPNGVNVNASGATTVFITFGGLADQSPAEAFWCGELVPAAPDLGQKCDPATIFGRLPLRYDLSRTQGAVFTDIMSIPPSVARRAYQAAEAGARSSFFYVRRFVTRGGGPDEYVFVTCRLAGGGARVPFSLLDVTVSFAGGEAVEVVEPGARPPRFAAEIAYNGTGRLRGRWEVVRPGEEPPSAEDLLTEATLPPSERGRQRRYASLERFNVFLPPTGRHVLPGPEASRLPTDVEGLYLVLLRVEAADDKEGDSNLALAGAGAGVVHSGAVAGFPMPVLRYYVGGRDRGGVDGPGLAPIAPSEDAVWTEAAGQAFSWTEVRHAAAFRLTIEGPDGAAIHSALLTPGVGVYPAPAWLRERAGEKALRWRVEALDPEGQVLGRTPWRSLRFAAR
jgi:hypothetical protein